MKLASRKKNYPTGGKSVESNPQDLSSWKILLVDDDPDIIKVTKLSLRNFVFSGLSLTILEANSAAEAKLIIHEHDDIAVLIE
jgi:CheY-like chemotaxis protein